MTDPRRRILQSLAVGAVMLLISAAFSAALRLPHVWPGAIVAGGLAGLQWLWFTRRRT